MSRGAGGPKPTRVFRLGRELHPKQQALADQGLRFALLRGGRRSTKSTYLLDRAIRACEKRGANAWIVGPSYRQVKEVAWNELFNMIPQAAIAHRNDTDLEIRLVNGARIALKGSDNEDSLRGPIGGLTFVGMTEAAFQKGFVWERILRPQLADQRGGAVIESSPKGRNWFWRLEQAVRAALERGDKEWGVEHWTIYNNPFMSVEEIESIKRSTSELTWRQEYLGEYDVAQGLVYPEFSEDLWPAGNLMPAMTPEQLQDLAKRQVPVYRGFDWGLKNPSACLGAYIEQTDRGPVVRFFREHYKAEMTIPQHARILKAQYDGMSLRATWCDRSLRNRTDTRDNRLLEFQRCGIPMIPALGGVDDGLEVVRRFLLERRATFTADLADTIGEIRTYEYEDIGDGADNADEKPRKAHDHAMDAVRYCLVMLNRLHRLVAVAAQGVEERVAALRADQLYLPAEPERGFAGDELTGAML